MRRPLVSVLMPAHNAERYVGAAVESVLAQTYSSIELVVVDDGSTDRTLAVARDFASPKVRVLAQENRGASAARNLALGHARGSYVQFLDADDLLHPKKIEGQVNRLSREAPESVASGMWGRFLTRPEDARFVRSELWEDLTGVEFLRRAWMRHLMMHPAAWLIPRELLDGVGPWDERLSLNDDGEYFARVALASRHIIFCAEARVYYRSGVQGSLSSRKSRSAQESQLLSLALCAEHLLAADHGEASRVAAAALMQRFIFEWYPNGPDLLMRARRLRDSIGRVHLAPDGPPGFHILRRVVGWRLARRIERLATRHGLGRSGLRRRLARG